MNLDEYLWRNKITNISFAYNLECSPNTLCKIKSHECSAGLLKALKIRDQSEGNIDIETLLSKKDRERYENWKSQKISNPV